MVYIIRSEGMVSNSLDTHVTHTPLAAFSLAEMVLSFQLDSDWMMAEAHCDWLDWHESRTAASWASR